MNSKYSISRFATGTLAAVAALLSTTACHDDFGYQNEAGQRIAFKLTAAEAWHNGMSVNENAPTTRCTSVQELSGDGDTQLYLHTVVADNPVAEPELTSRGTPITSIKAFQDTYEKFSLSGILVTDGKSVDEVAPSFAHNRLYSTTSGLQTDDGDQLLWPWTGSVHYFAFAPTIASFGENSPLKISDASQIGAPTLTYTVPTDVTKQVDLMTATKIATLPSENLEFKHALTAVQIKCGENMLAGTITEVTISGIHGTGSLKIGSENETIGLDWKTSTPTTYTISKAIVLSPSNNEDVADKTHAPVGTPIVGTDDDDLTFLLLPQVLPKDATMTIKFTDAATQTPRTLTGSIAGQTWEAGKIVTYSISPSSINIKATVELGKKGDDDKNLTDYIMPYSGVWYDVQYNPAKVEIVQAGVESKQIDEIPVDKISYQYKLDGSENWVDCTTDTKGLLTIAPQSEYAELRKKFADTETEIGSEASPVSLTVNGETANCYLVDQAGYFSLPLVYGNGNTSGGNTNALNYYPKHDDGRMPSDGKISGASDAVLCWQDSPDLIDPKSVIIDGDKLVFHIRKETLAQGNALLAVRNSDKTILWSWHIWVTPYKSDFYKNFFHSTTYKNKDGVGENTPLKEYDFAKYNLGWCDSHDPNPSRKFSLRAVVDMSAYGGEKETSVEIGTFTQDVFKGSDAGDNTYYQWGRKDPMLGGIYNNDTPTYSYTKKKTESTTSTTKEENEFTMENKQVFNQYKECDEAGNVVYNYSFCKNPGDMITALHPSIDATASKGVTIGYSIRHPYMFITNSEAHDVSPSIPFNYRNHWHCRYLDNQVPYLNADTHIMFNAWDAGATCAGASDNSDANNYYNNVFDSNGIIKESVMVDYMKSNAADIQKSVYDPCPPKFKVPPIDAFRGIAQARGSNDGKYALGTINYSNNTWTITNDGGSIEFPMTGVRNYALRSTEWKTVNLKSSESTTSNFDYESFYKISMPAFRMLTFVSSATIVSKGSYNAYQLLIFAIDKSNRDNVHSNTNVKMSCYSTSSNSYGLPVRPIKDTTNGN